jgi:hypothetical protein
VCCVQVRHEKDEPVEDLLALVKQIVPYHMTHNAGMAHGRMRIWMGDRGCMSSRGLEGGGAE